MKVEVREALENFMYQLIEEHNTNISTLEASKKLEHISSEAIREIEIRIDELERQVKNLDGYINQVREGWGVVFDYQLPF